MVKLEWYREKKELLSWKYLNGLPRAIHPDDVMEGSVDKDDNENE
jgi:hypothetical protein